MIQEDHLSREPFIFLLKDIISAQLTNEKGFTFAINGEWGCGKTWIINELEKEYTEDQKYLILKYNAWENDFYDEPLEAIISVFIKTVNDSKTNIKGKNTIVKSLFSIAKLTGKTIENTIGLPINDIPDEIKNIKNKSDINIEEINKQLPLSNALETIHKIIKDISKNKKIILIIDELDRCLPEYAIKVLERLHHISHNQPLINLLAINKRKLANNINSVFGNYGSSEEEIEKTADEYLEKFINLTIPLDNGAITLNKVEVYLNFDKEFIPYDNFGDKAFLMDFYTTFLSSISKREQEEIINKVKLIHNITINRGYELETYSTFILCLEIFELLIIKHNINKEYLILGTNEIASGIYLGTSTTFQDKDINLFFQQLRNFTTTGFLNSINDKEGHPIYFIPDCNELFFINYFLPVPNDTQKDEYNLKIARDQEFLSHYKETLYSLY